MTHPLPSRRLRFLLAALVVGAALAAAWPAAAPVAEAQAPIVVRMATLVPDGSSWHLILKEAADKWKQVSGGRVTVRLFPGGVAGDDPDVVRKMRLGTLNAGVLTSVGVAEIDKSVYAMGIPLMYDSYEEVYWVHEKMRPKLEASLEAKGFVVLNWADGGWVHFFAKKPVAVPDDLRKPGDVRRERGDLGRAFEHDEHVRHPVVVELDRERRPADSERCEQIPGTQERGDRRQRLLHPAKDHLRPLPLERHRHDAGRRLDAQRGAL